MAWSVVISDVPVNCNSENKISWNNNFQRMYGLPSTISKKNKYLSTPTRHSVLNSLTLGLRQPIRAFTSPAITYTHRLHH